MIRTLVLAAIVAILGASPAMAQETRGTIDGVVKDSTGGVLPGVTVQAAITGGISQTTVTDARGVYHFPALPPGSYTVTSSLSGFNTAKIENVKVDIGKILTIDLTMAPASLATSVEVTAEAPVVDVKQSAVTQIVTSETIDLIPKSSTGILGALAGLPGSGTEGRLGGFGIDGAGASENRYIVDGMDAGGLQSGTLAKDLNISFIDTIQVKTSGYNAEYRAATGGVVTAVTKSGTNKFHGEFNEFLSGRPLRGLQGDVRPQLRLVPSDNTKAEYFYTPRLNETTTSNPTVSLGGPVFQDKMWFFMGYNPQWSNQVRTVTWTTPAAFAGQTQTMDSKTKDTTTIYNVTYQVSSDKRIRFSGNNEPTTGGLGLPAIDSNTGQSTSNAATFNPRSPIYTEGFSNQYSGVFDWNIDKSSYMNITGGYLGYGSHSTGGDYYHGTRRTFGTSNINYLDVPANLQQNSGYNDNLSNTFNAQNDFSRITVNADYTRYFDLKGSHTLKAGVQLERFSNVLNNGQQYPNVTLNWNSTRATLAGQNVRGAYGYYVVTRQYTVGNVHSNNMGMFIQDQWTPSRRLTVNYGVRVDQTNIPSYREENPGIKFSFMDKVAPRLGFAYDLTGDGKWKAYGSYGTFYDIEKLEMPLGSFGAQHWIQYYWTLDNYNWPAIDCTGEPGSGCPGTFIEQNDLRHVSNGTGAENLIDPGLKPYRSAETTYGVEHQLGRTMSISSRYTHKWIGEAIEDVGVQVVGVGEVFYTANPGKGLGEFPLGRNYPATPAPKRHYDGVDVTFRRRLQNNWALTGSLLWSRTWGSYSGLTSSDENGRNSPGVNRFYDGLYMSFDQSVSPVYGRLQSDRPWQLKVQPIYILPWGTQAGAEIDVESGNPQSSTVTFTGVPVFVYGRNDLGYSPMYSYTNLNFQQEFKMPKGTAIMVALNIENLFDQMAVTTFSTSPYRDALTFPQCAGLTGTTGSTCSNNAFFAGFDTAAVMAAVNAKTPTTGRPDPRYKLASGYQNFRTARLQVRFRF